MTDIPFSNYFHVEMRWDVVRGAKASSCEISLNMAVPFSKKTVFSSRIVASARDDTLKQFQLYVDMATRQLARRRAVSARRPVAKDEDIPEEWRDTVQGMLKVRLPRSS
jgi:hypothetical protein